MSASASNNSENAATTAGRPGLPKGSVRGQFVHQSENLIKRIAADLPEDFLTLAMSNRADVSDDTLAHSIEQFGDLDPIKRVLLLRAVRAITQMIRDMPSDLLFSALAAPSDFGALARALSDPRVSDPIDEIDPLAGAVGRSIAHRRRLLSMAGEMLSSSQVENLLGIKRQAIDKRRKGHKLLAVRLASDWLYPAFQFGDDDVLPGIQAVLKAHKQNEPWVVLDILLTSDDALGGRTLLCAINEGDEKAVARHIAQVNGNGFG